MRELVMSASPSFLLPTSPLRVNIDFSLTSLCSMTTSVQLPTRVFGLTLLQLQCSYPRMIQSANTVSTNEAWGAARNLPGVKSKTPQDDWLLKVSLIFRPRH